MPLRVRFVLAFTLLALSAVLAADPDKRFAPPPPRDAARLGTGVQRTLSLLAHSTADRHHTVRILFYGQSITEQDWWKDVVADLKKRFPHADIEAENRAIGGFASQRLIHSAEQDLYPFYPDLLIFHVYGSDREYEQIIQNVRRRTAAEVLMQTDHVTAWPPATIAPAKDKAAWWTDFMNSKRLPEIAAKYGCGLADVRSGWFDYLRANHLEPKDLLKDDVHLNAHGNYLMAELVKRHLVVNAKLPPTERDDLSQTLEVRKDVFWKDGKLILEFEGNRVDAVAGRVLLKSSAAQVRVNGKRPSDWASCYRATRPQPGPWSALTVTRVAWDQLPTSEEWTLQITEISGDGKSWKFTVSGSETGPDGSGESAKTFRSKSGRVRIEPDWWFRYDAIALPVGYTIRWKTELMGVDRYKPPKWEDPTREVVVTLVQGLPNGKHRLELANLGQGEVPIRKLRVYRPPVK